MAFRCEVAVVFCDLRGCVEITSRDLVTVPHGMGFGALFMLAFSGALAELYRITVPGQGDGHEREGADRA